MMSRSVTCSLALQCLHVMKLPLPVSAYKAVAFVCWSLQGLYVIARATKSQAVESLISELRVFQFPKQVGLPEIFLGPYGTGLAMQETDDGLTIFMRNIQNVYSMEFKVCSFR